MRDALEGMLPEERLVVLLHVTQEIARALPVRRAPEVLPSRDVDESRRPLTLRQRRVLEWICDYQRSNGFPPTMRELGAGLGISSTNGVNDHLRALERKGYIERVDTTSRGLRVLQRAG